MQEKPENKGFLDGGGDPGRIRTCDLQLRRTSGKHLTSMPFETFSVSKIALLRSKLTLMRVRKMLIADLRRIPTELAAGAFERSRAGQSTAVASAASGASSRLPWAPVRAQGERAARGAMAFWGDDG
jgi:hypothetical protein